MPKGRVIAVACAAAIAVATLLLVAFGKAFQPDSAVPGPALEAAGAPSVEATGRHASIANQAGESASESTADPSADFPPDEPEYVPGVVLVEIADSLTLDEVNTRLARLDYIAADSVSEDDLVYGYVALDLAGGVSVEDALQRLQGEDFVAAVQPNYVYHLLDADEGAPSPPVAEASPPSEAPQPAAAEARPSPETPQPVATSQLAPSLQPVAPAAFTSGGMTAQSTSLNDPRSSSQWALEAVNAYEAWDYARVNGSVTVAVLDSGVNVNHEDLKGRVVGAYSVLQAKKTGGDTRDVTDELGHGTHVAGIIAATSNNGKGVSGVSYNANIMPVQVIETTSKVTSLDAAAGIRHIVSVADAYKVRIINLSFGATTEQSSASAPNDRAFLNALRSAHDAGLLVVHASGNGGSSGAYKCFPSDFDADGIGVISVTRKNGTYARSPTSNYNSAELREAGSVKELSAPGGSSGDQVLSTVSSATSSNAAYGNKHGTSMVAPHVSAVAALLFAAKPTLTASQVKQVLIDTAQDLNASANLSRETTFDYETGYGLVDAAAALRAVGAVAPSVSGIASVGVGGTTRFGVSDSSGTWSWESGDGSIASVSPSGVVSGISAGSAVITATRDHTAISQLVSVYDPAIIGADTVEYGSRIQLGVSAGNPAGEWSWAPDAPDAPVAVEPGGLAYGRALGTANVAVTLVSPQAAGTVAAAKAITVVPADLKRAELEGVEDQVLDEGTPATLPDLRVFMPVYERASSGAFELTRRELRLGTDYDVVYEGNDAKGTAAFTVQGKGNFTGEVSGTFRIGGSTVRDARASIAGAPVYTGQPVTVTGLVVSLADGGELVEGVDYEVSYRNNTNAGYGYVVVRGVGDRVGTTTFPFRIEPVNIAGDEVSLDSSSIRDKTYAGAAVTQAPQLTYNGMTLVEGEDFQVLYADNENAGRATLWIAGYPASWDDEAQVYSGGNYYSTWDPQSPGARPSADYRTASFEILPASIGSAQIAVAAQTYTGSALTPDPSVTLNGVALAGGVDYTASYSDNVNVGSGRVELVGRGNFTGSAVGTFAIGPASVGRMSLSPTSYSYDGKPCEPTVSATGSNGRSLVPGVDFDVSYSGNADVGTATATVTGKGSYAGSVSASFRITHAAALSGFTDLEAGRWYADPAWGGAFPGTDTLFLEYVLVHGIMSGYADGSGRFGPDDGLSRAMVATIIYRAATGEQGAGGFGAGFSDVADGQWYTEPVRWCAAHGIVTGYSKTDRFGPDDPVTREQLATMAARYCAFAGAPEPENPAPAFADAAQVSSWAADSVSYCAAAGIVGGYADGTGRFAPQDGATRCQMAKVIAIIERTVLAK